MRIAALALVFASSFAFAADEDPIQNPRLPRMWKLVERRKVPAEQVEALSKKLELPMKSLENSVIDAGGIGVKVNIAQCADEEQAEALRKRFAVIHGGDDLYAMRRGCDVAEISCVNRAVARKARDLIGWTTEGQYGIEPACYRVTMQVAPLVRCDSMRWNRLFNLLSKSDDPKNAAAIQEEAKAFEFSDHVGPGDSPASHVFGVPKVERTQDVSAPCFRTSSSTDIVLTWLDATASWPVKAPEVQAAAKAALGDDPPKSKRDRAERVLAWVHAHVRYGGDVVGSRYGTTKVMAQGFGRCWDQSDVFVTLCRAADVPARQVGGWLKGGEGHVWAEIVVGEKDGWSEVLAVDPGTTWLGVSEDYVRLWTSDDGRIPFVYWGAPKIEQLADVK
jgi:hypothetical protein